MLATWSAVVVGESFVVVVASKGLFRCNAKRELKKKETGPIFVVDRGCHTDVPGAAVAAAGKAGAAARALASQGLG